MSVKIQIRRDTATNWATVNPILSQGEIGYETNTGKLKIGDGITVWNSLSYYSTSTLTSDQQDALDNANAPDALNPFATMADIGSGVTPSALTKVNDTNVTLTLGGTPSTSLLQPVSLTLGWTGTLADARITSASTWNSKVSTVSGTSNRITTSGTTAIIVDIAATYVGQSSITTLGTISSGIWHGTPIDITYGGTGLSSLGTALQLLRVNAGATALEYFTPSYLTSESDPVFTASDAAGITSTNISNWNTAFGWGNHAIAGYLLSSTAASTYQPLDSDLTAISALTTDSFGRDLLTKTTASSIRSYIGAGTGNGDALTTNPLSQFASTTSAQLRGVLSDETGTGLAVFNDTPTFISPILGTPSSGNLANCTFPTLNQNTTGSAATLTTSRNIQGVAFNGSANIDIINGTGFVKATGTTLSYDNSTYLTTSSAASTYQPLDATLTALAGLSTGSNKIPYSTGTDTFSQLTLDTDGTLAANSDTTLATQKAVKTYADTKQALSSAAYTMHANNTNATANMTDITYKSFTNLTYSGTVTFTFSGAAPSGTSVIRYSWSQLNKTVTFTLTSYYPTNGIGVTAVTFTLPTDMPNPAEPTGTGAADDLLYPCTGFMTTNYSTRPTVAGFAELKVNTGDTGYEFRVGQASHSNRYTVISGQYTCV